MAVEPLHANVVIDGQVSHVDTTVPNYTIKNVFRYSGRGYYYTGVFLEGGSNRKEYFSKQKGSDGTKETSYKGTRDTANKIGSFYEGVNLAVNLMQNGGVSLYRMGGREADDLIAATVRKIKAVDSVTPIDIITNDSDMLPLVDDQVSVYMRGTRQYAEDGCPEHRLYYQVTPNSWTDYLSYTSQFKQYNIPYNSMLLFKMIRGDKADGVSGACTGYGGKKYSLLMEQMLRDEIDFPNVFRYGNDFNLVMRPVLEDYFSKEEIDYMKYIYEGIRPKHSNLLPPKQIEQGKLAGALAPVMINII
jgi:DNA polymerase-1